MEKCAIEDEEGGDMVLNRNIFLAFKLIQGEL